MTAFFVSKSHIHIFMSIKNQYSIFMYDSSQMVPNIFFLLKQGKDQVR